MNQHTALVSAVRAALDTGVSMRGLAKTAGVSHTTISKLMSGESLNVSLKTYQRLMSATESNMKTITTHDHAAATLEAVEQAALERGKGADIGLRDTELECAKYRRVMALEAELDVWQLKCGKERDKSEQQAAKDAAMILGLNMSNECLQNELRKAEALTQAVSRDLQIMTASWKAVSVERDTLEQQVAKDSAMILGLNMSNDGLQAERDWLHDQLLELGQEYTKLQNAEGKAAAFAGASGIALLLVAIQAMFVAFGGGV